MNPKMAVVLSIVFTLALTNAAVGDDAAMIQGTWLPQEARVSGQLLPPAQLKDNYLVLSVESYVNQTKGSTEKGSYAINPRATPKSIDLKVTEGPNKGMTFPGIYELDDNLLTVCLDISGKQRPTEFTADNVGPLVLLIKYERNIIGR